MTAANTVNGHPIAEEVTSPETSENAAFEDVAELESERQRLRQREDVLADDVFATARTDGEVDKDRAVDQQIRAKQREHRLKQGLASVDKQARLDRQDDKQQVTLRKAERKRAELTDSGRKLAATFRQYKGVSAMLSATTLVGIGWTSWNVATGLSHGAAPTNLLLYGIEPLFSVLLVAIVLMQMAASLHGRLHRMSPLTPPDPTGRRRLSTVGLIEAFLLVGTTAIGIWPSVTDAVNGQFDGQMFAVRLLAPSLVVLSVVLQLVAAELFGDIIRDAQLAGDEDQDPNLRERSRRVSALVKQVQDAMREGSIELREDGLPSVSTISKQFPNDKRVVQSAHDALVMFHTEGGE